MSKNILTYLQQYGEYSLFEMPFSSVDALILCQLVYLKFDGIVPCLYENRRAVTLHGIRQSKRFEHLFADTRFEKNNRALFERLKKSRRFHKLKLNHFVDIVEPKWQTQFAAVTFYLEDGSIFLAFRGTDESLVGWKEDFNMSFERPILSQQYALRYLEKVVPGQDGPVRIGGHSKGGNLALYAGMCCGDLREKITQIYSMDGPGIPREVLIEKNYENIAGRVIKILPRASLVGMLFEDALPYLIVESRAFGILQHDPFSWLVEGEDFVYAKNLYASSKRTEMTVNRWIMGLSKEERRVFSDALYSVFLASESTDLIGFTKNLKKSLKGMLFALKKLEPGTKKVLRKVLFCLIKLFFVTGATGEKKAQ